MGSCWKSSFSKNTQKHVFCALSLNISYKIHFFFGEKILVTLDTYAKKMNPPSIILGGVHGKVCWLIAYNLPHARHVKRDIRHRIAQTCTTANNIEFSFLTEL